MVVFAVIGCLLLISLLGFETDRVVETMLRFLSPIFGLQMIVIVICALATIVVHVLTAVFPEQFSVSSYRDYQRILFNSTRTFAFFQHLARVGFQRFSGCVSHDRGPAEQEMPADYDCSIPMMELHQCIEGVDHPEKDHGALGLKICKLGTHHVRQNHSCRFTCF